MSASTSLKSWAPELMDIKGRRKALARELADLDLQQRAAETGVKFWLPPVTRDLPNREVSDRLEQSLQHWPEAPQDRLAFLAEICPPGDRDAYLLLRLQLRGWLKELARRQRLLRADTRCDKPSIRDLALLRHNRRIITRLIEVRRASRRYAGAMAELATSL